MVKQISLAKARKQNIDIRTQQSKRIEEGEREDLTTQASSIGHI